jgi:CheY-like chemotaxis protein
MSEAITLLVTDDDRRMLVLTTEVLGEAGYEVLQASTGKECLEALKAHHPDIALLDVMLPDTTGIELCKQIKADERLQDIFVILCQPRLGRLHGVGDTQRHEAAPGSWWFNLRRAPGQVGVTALLNGS